MKIKSKITFLFCYSLCISVFAFGQKKLNVGLSLGIFQGVSAERYSARLSQAMGQAVVSSLDYAPSLLAGIVVATPFDKQKYQFRTGLELHLFHYTLATSFFTPSETIFNQTVTTNSVVQLPLGFVKHWGHFMLYGGSGLAFFRTRDNSTESEKAVFDPNHLAFVEKTLTNFKKIYPIYECSIGWQVQQSSVEIGYRGAGEVRKTNSSPIAFNGSRGIVYLGTKFFLGRK
ncbi:MAG: hypothetical protein RLZZ292_950 [Bacteroidota bacterium]|jgi:hypothetical protein